MGRAQAPELRRALHFPEGEVRRAARSVGCRFVFILARSRHPAPGTAWPRGRQRRARGKHGGVGTRAAPARHARPQVPSQWASDQSEAAYKALGQLDVDCERIRALGRIHPGDEATAAASALPPPLRCSALKCTRCHTRRKGTS